MFLNLVQKRLSLFSMLESGLWMDGWLGGQHNHLPQ